MQTICTATIKSEILASIQSCIVDCKYTIYSIYMYKFFVINTREQKNRRPTHAVTQSLSEVHVVGGSDQIETIALTIPRSFNLHVVSQAGRLLLSHITRESVVDVVLVTSLQFTGSNSVFGVEVLKQDQYITCNQCSWTGRFLTFLNISHFFKPTEILQFNIMNCSRITCVVKCQ